MTRYPYLILAALVVGADRLVKWWVQGHVFLPRTLIPGFIRLNLVHNMGGAFGIFPRSGPLFIVISSLVSVGIAAALLFAPLHGRLLKFGLGFVLGGAVGNLIDRIRFGYVLDFFEVRWFSVFNLADACITVGVVLIIIHTLFFAGGRDGA
jgi:signal peptidase II